MPKESVFWGIVLAIGILMLSGSIAVLSWRESRIASVQTAFPIKPTKETASAGKSQTQFSEDFSETFSIEETGSFTDIAHKDWWVSSGAFLQSEQGIGKTLHAELPSLSLWRMLYRISNPTDTDNGFHPQNIFRAITRTQWVDHEQELLFRIDRAHISDSSNRNQTNGVFLMGRYHDKNNVYYAGVRADGHAVIKKKLNGKYTTLAYVRVFPGTYDRATHNFLLPVNSWIGLKTIITNTPEGWVRLQLFIDASNSGNWQSIADVTDRTAPENNLLSQKGSSGIRTDFMDVSFDAYRVDTNTDNGTQ